MPVTRAHKSETKSRRKPLAAAQSVAADVAVSRPRRAVKHEVKETVDKKVSHDKKDNEAQEAAEILQPTSDNRVQVPSASNALLARKQTLTESTIATSERIHVQSATLADIGNIGNIGNSSDNTSQSTSPVLTSSGSIAASAGNSNSTTNRSKQKRKNLLPTPTSGLTATQGNGDGGDDETDGTATPSSKRCCKSDLKRCLRVGDWIENIRIDQKILKTRNAGKRLFAQFDGQNFIDFQTEKEYRSISDWIKQRMIDLGAISETSNISGWDYAVVHRDGRTTALRLLVEETKQKMELMHNAMKEQRQSNSPSPLAPTVFSGGPSLPVLDKFKFSTPSFSSGPPVNIAASPNLPNDVMLHNRLQSARQQVAELEQMLYVGRSN